LIKLTDFGLSRFVDIRTEEEKKRDREARRSRTRMRRGGSESESGDEQKEEIEEEYEGPLLSTRCGSEAYAAPELVMGGAGGQGVYDARETDAWACGVVLYALVGRRLPFGEGAGSEGGVGVGIKGEGAGRGGGGRGGTGRRRQWLMRIAKGEYEWPVCDCWDEFGIGGTESNAAVKEKVGEELIGRRLVESEGARRMVGKLLVRDPKKRARVSELWGDEWMFGGRSGAGEEEDKEEDGDLAVHDVGVGVSDPDPERHLEQEQEQEQMADGEYDFCDASGDAEADEEELETEMEIEMEELEKEEEDADGWLVDRDGIDSIARREVI
jgi:protein-serine/threonine kinase